MSKVEFMREAGCGYLKSFINEVFELIESSYHSETTHIMIMEKKLKKEFNLTNSKYCIMMLMFFDCASLRSTMRKTQEIFEDMFSDNFSRLMYTNGGVMKVMLAGEKIKAMENCFRKLGMELI